MGVKTMHKSRLMLPCLIVFALTGAQLARAQDGTSSLDDQIQNKYSEREPDKSTTTHQQDKTKVKDTNDGHRKHWWSLPHFHHKKKDDNSARQPESKVDSKALAAKRANNTGLQQASSHKAASGKSGHTTVAAKKNTHKPVASATPHKKTVAATSQAKKPLRHDCSATKAKSGGCQAAKKRSVKTNTSRS
jgi:hypothetical protein